MEIDDKAKKCPHCREKQGNWAQRHPIITGVVGIFVLLIMIGAASGDSSKSTNTSGSSVAGTASNEVVEPTPTPTPDTRTVSQKNAVRKAESYLSMGGFSKKGLIHQLEYEKFSKEDATFAVENVEVDWMEQVEKKANSYQDMSGFSRASLIHQLEYEGFTTEEANHGADSVGL